MENKQKNYKSLSINCWLSSLKKIMIKFRIYNLKILKIKNLNIVKFSARKDFAVTELFFFIVLLSLLLKICFLFLFVLFSLQRLKIRSKKVIAINTWKVQWMNESTQNVNTEPFELQLRSVSDQTIHIWKKKKMKRSFKLNTFSYCHKSKLNKHRYSEWTD